MVRICAPFALGLLVTQLFDPTPVLLWPMVLVTALVAGILVYRPVPYPVRWHRGASLSLFLFAFGALWSDIRRPASATDHFAYVGSAPELMLVELADIDRSASGYWRGEAHVVGWRKADSLVLGSGGLRVTLGPDSACPRLVAGDRLWLDAPAEPIARVPDPGGFDAAAWAAGRGIEHEVFAPVGLWSFQEHQRSWLDLFASMRERIGVWLRDSGLPDRERAIVKALLLGQRDELDPEQRDAFSRSGTMHVLAVSGMHVGLIYACMAVLLGWWGKRKGARTLRGVLIILALWVFAGITGGSPSVVRAAFMFSLFTVAGLGGRYTDALNSLFAAGFVMLLFDPLMLVQLSFQLSFLAVLGIALFYRPILHLWTPSNTIAGYFWSLFSVSLAAQTLTTPLALLMFKAFPVYFLPANLIVVGLVALSVYGGLLLLVCGKVPWVGELLVKALTALLKVLGAVTDFFARLPGAYPDVRIDALQCVLLYLLIGALGVWWFWRWKGSLSVALGILLVLLVSWAVHAGRRDVQEGYVIYGDRKQLEVAVVQGRDMVVFTDSVDRWVERRTEAHQRAWGIRTVSFAPSVVMKDGSLILPEGMDIVRIAPNGPAPSMHPVLFHGREWRAEDTTPADLFGAVLAPTVPPWIRSELREQLDAAGVPAHDVANDGAFIVLR